MAQYLFNFESDTVNQQPPDTSTPWATGNTLWRVREKSNPWGDNVLELTQSAAQLGDNFALSFDSIISHTDVEILYSWRSTSTAGVRGMGVARGAGSSSSEDGYLAGNSATSFVLRRLENGTGTNFSGAIAGAFSTNTWYLIRFRVEGTALKAKFWENGSSEPGSWHIEQTHSGITAAGFIGLFTGTASGTQDFGFFSVGTAGDAAPEQVEFVSQVAGSQTFGSSRSVNTPEDVEPGDYMLAYWNTGGAGVTATGWDVVANIPIASNHVVTILARVVGESEPSSHSFTLSSSIAARWHVSAYRNVDLSEPFVHTRRFHGAVSQPLVGMDPLVANRHGSAILTWAGVGTASVTLVLDDWFEKISEQTTTRSVTATMNIVNAGTVSPPWTLRDSGSNSRAYAGTGLTLQPIGNDTPPTTLYGIDTVAGSESNTTSHEISFSPWTMPTEGTFLLMYLRHLSSGGIVATLPSGWTQLYGPIEYTSGATVFLYGKFYEESDGSSVTVTYNGGAGSAINIKQFANVDESDPFNFADHDTGNSNKASAPTPSKDAGFYEYRASFNQNLNTSSVDNALYTRSVNASGYGAQSAFLLHDGGTLPAVAFNYGTTAAWVALVLALNEIAEPGEEPPPMPINVAANALDHQSIHTTADPGD